MQVERDSDGVRGPVNLGGEVSEEGFAEDAIVTWQVKEDPPDSQDMLAGY